MIVEVTRKVRVSVSQRDVEKFRKDNRNCATIGVLSKDTNIIYILALNYSLDMISQLDDNVAVETSVDDQVDVASVKS